MIFSHGLLSRGVSTPACSLAGSSHLDRATDDLTYKGFLGTLSVHSAISLSLMNFFYMKMYS